MIRLTRQQILLLHDQLVAETGGEAALRDEGMLDSALHAPFQTFGDEDVYHTTAKSRQALLRSCQKSSIRRWE